MGTESKAHPPTQPAALSATGAYVPGDPIPVPEAIEKNSETAWALWTDAVASQEYKETTFADTVPASDWLLEEEAKKSAK